MLLSETLSKTVDVVRDAVPPHIFSEIAQSIEDLKSSGLAQRAASVGSKPDLPVLKAIDGSSVDLRATAENGPLVLIFYRGGWCPYCNVALNAFAGLNAEFQSAGAEIVAVTPELESRALETGSKNAVPFPIAIDVSNAFARSLGLVFSLPAPLQPLYRQIGIDLGEWNGDATHELPIPATYVIDRTGVVRWAFVEADFTKRAEPSEVLKAVRSLT